MGAYILRRLLLIIPTIIGIMAISFAVIQFAPGGPVEQVIADLTGQGGSSEERLSGGGNDLAMQESALNDEVASKYRGAQGLDPEFIKKLEKQFGFDKPPLERFLTMMWNYSRFDFGESFFSNESVLSMIIKRLPVSMSLGVWILLFSYVISIPLGIQKAVKDGSAFDVWTSGVIIVGYAVPSFLFGILLIVLFAGGSFYDWFPLRGLVSDNFDSLPWYQKIADYFWHLTLPLIALSLSAFATTTLLTKNSFLDEIRKQYVVTARAKGLAENQVLCLSQCDADYHCRFPRRFHFGLLHRIAADRKHLFPRWSRAARLSVRCETGLSGRVWNAVHLFPDGSGHRPHFRSHLYLG
jgi:microcin C transport system permease protein